MTHSVQATDAGAQLTRRSHAREASTQPKADSEGTPAILALQRALGNQAVGGLLARAPDLLLVQRTSSPTRKRYRPGLSIEIDSELSGESESDEPEREDPRRT